MPTKKNRSKSEKLSVDLVTNPYQQEKSFVVGDVRAKLPELVEIETLRDATVGIGTVEVISRIEHEGITLPIHAFVFGNPSPSAPVFGIFGGVHGLERIGTHVALSYLKTFTALLRWDPMVRALMKEARLVAVPLINPVGMYLRQRSNGRGVDLMRNAPIEADDAPEYPLVGGQRISNLLPWFRGPVNQPMEIESQAVVDFVRQQMQHSNCSIALDIHSGFGTVDRLWFPYARTRKPFHHLADMLKLMELLDRTYPHHVYKVEPQSASYTTHGDIWDYLYDGHLESFGGERLFLPLTLELGSWMWVKKNPRQFFSALGAFNPVIQHRYKRILRRHLYLLDFLLRASIARSAWTPSLKQRLELEQRAQARWFSPGKM